MVSDGVTLSVRECLLVLMGLPSWGYPMPTRRRIALTDDVYEALMELREKWGLESPNQVIRELIKRVTPLLGVTPSDRVTPSEEGLTEGTQGVTPTNFEGVTQSEGTIANGVTPTKISDEGVWSPICDLWSKVRDRITYDEYMYNEFRKLLEEALPKFNSNELIEEFEACGLIEVQGNVVSVKK